MIENPWVLSDPDEGPDIPDPECPICGHGRPESIYLVDGEVVGCEHCIQVMDASDWAYEQWEKEMEASREAIEEREWR